MAKLLLIDDFYENKYHIRAEVNSGILLVVVFISFHFIVFKNLAPFIETEVQIRALVCVLVGQNNTI